MTLVELQLMLNFISPWKNLLRTHQRVSTIQNTIEAQGKSTAQDPFDSKGAQFLPEVGLVCMCYCKSQN